ncbi:hypothetical protein ACHHYP_04231 [Achlya hypogyna]|uniref:Aminotransferase class V domain-containing protein n=1 Tax=Achlya hypogyna TaxID=1202772 RepID=A0A1V9ZPC4_ACHHY|nr:hypothetical protein ACHHYP_04231 [Achlya hypogyna]
MQRLLRLQSRVVALPPLRRQLSVQATGYTSVGSFHTPSIDDIFDQDDVPLPVAMHFEGPPSSFGSHMRQHFLLDQDWTFINHGAFGASLRSGVTAANAWRDLAERQPLKFYDREFFFYLVYAIKQLATTLQAPPKDLVLLPNATSGLNAVIQSMAATMQPGDSIYSLDVAYGAVKKLLHQVCSERRLVHESHVLSFADAHCDDAIVARIAATLPQSGCRLVVLDHVTSNTATVLPVQRIVELCHARGIPVLVDGAHGLLNLDLDLAAIGADFYVGNCHKWLSSPKGAAFLHVQPHYQAVVRPQVQSHGMGDGFQSTFMWTGLQDYSALLALPACLSFWAAHDMSAIRAYMHGTVDTAVAELARAWRMDEAPSSPPPQKQSSMRLVALPPGVFGTALKPTSVDAKLVQDTLHFLHMIEAPVKCVEGRLYVRLSAHVYNTTEDYARLADVVRAGVTQSQKVV